MKTVLVVAAHPDDEVLGCGGAMARHVAQGDRVVTCFLTNGVSARSESESEEAIKERSNMADEAGGVLGVAGSYRFDFPDNRLDSLALLDVVKAVESVIDQERPNIVYTHFAHDLNVDHRIAHQAVMTVCRPQPGFCVRQIYCFEVLSSTEWQSASYAAFQPNVYFDISKYWHKKEAALQSYSKEMRVYPHTRSIKALENLAMFRGASVGVCFAEAFVLVRSVM